MSDDLATYAAEAKSWPFQEARALAEHVKDKPADQPVIFETGYGPSGLPHIGTFGEVARTTMVRRAFELLTGRPTRLIAFSDDMDGLRKVPPGLPQQEMLEAHLQIPLSRIPDPFGTHESYAAHNNARLRKFLDDFGFEYDFYSATECYASGRFDEMLLEVLRHYEAVRNVILPTLGEERRKSYAPFLPISPKTGRVLYVPILETDAEAGTIVFEDEDGSRIETPVTGGAVKLQWKADWAGRWRALGVDYEMAGEDLSESVKLSSKIVRVLGGRPPIGISYQLFLDEKGEKISKSKGNGITIEEWLRYASPESLSLYMFQAPKKAKKLYFDIIPKTADEYISHAEKFGALEGAARLDSPIWHIHGGAAPTPPPVSFSLLLNLVTATGDSDPSVLRGFVRKYKPQADDAAMAALDRMIAYATAYFEDFVKPSLSPRAPDERERAGLLFLRDALAELGDNASEDDYQTAVFSAGKAQGYENIRDWFSGLYEVLFGQPQGPRMGPFIAVYGRKETIDKIDEALSRN
ncbi:MAG: lysine--tRNA ligase [Parvularculaceae bacterium]